MKRKLTPDDRKILTKVFKENGADWTYKALAVWYAVMPLDELTKVKRWTTRRLAAFRFLRELIEDYTFNAIYNAADEIAKPDALVECGAETTTPQHRKRKA
jgi:hypothetical protein